MEYLTARGAAGPFQLRLFFVLPPAGGAQAGHSLLDQREPARDAARQRAVGKLLEDLLTGRGGLTPEEPRQRREVLPEEAGSRDSTWSTWFSHGRAPVSGSSAGARERFRTLCSQSLPFPRRTGWGCCRGSE